jgi:hypothetical protein
MAAIINEVTEDLQAENVRQGLRRVSRMDDEDDRDGEYVLKRNDTFGKTLPSKWRYASGKKFSAQKKYK